MYYDSHSIVEFSVKWGHGNNQFLGNQEASYEEVCKVCQPTGWKQLVMSILAPQSWCVTAD